MPFTPIDPERLSASVVRQIELLILRGVLGPGERLPAERDLAERLGVSRPSLREALQDLETRGLVQRRAGAGIFVGDLIEPAFSEPMIRLLSAHEEAVLDYIAFRRDIEGLAADRAARFGSNTDLALIAEIFRQMEEAHGARSGAEETRLDAEFHMAILEASHNLILLHVMRASFQLLREGVFQNRQTLFRQRNTRSALLDQHRAINDAIQARDPAAARAAVSAHLDFVERSILEERKSAQNEEIARLRLRHATGE